jgi:hypothetical protein
VNDLIELLNAAVDKGGAVVATVIMAYFWWQADKERRSYLKIILEVMPKQTNALNKLRRLIAGIKAGDDDDEEDEN